MPPSLTPHMGKLVEFNTSCASVFTQRAGVVAVQRTDEVTPVWWLHLKACRDTLVPLLQALPGGRWRPPRAGCTPFPARRPMMPLATAKRLVAEAGLGLAPGQRVCARGARLAALVLCVERPWARLGRAWIGWNPGWPPRQPESVAGAIILAFCIPQNARWGAVPAPNASQNPFRN